MQIIKRQMQVEKSTTSESFAVQASLNSDGVITLRHFEYDFETDEVLVFTREETEAIFKLFKQIKNKNNGELPF